MDPGVCLLGPGGRGGIQSYTRSLAAHLRATWPGRPVTVIDTRGPRGATSGLWLAAALARLVVAAATGRAQAAHLMASERLSLPRKALLAAAARLLGLRVIVHHHGADLIAPEGAPGPVGRAALRLTARAAHRHLVLGRAWAQVLTAHGAPPDRVEVLANALPDAPPEVPEPARTRSDGRPLRILFLAVMTERKGARVLLRALARLRAQGIAFEALLVGDGPDRAAAMAQAADLGLDPGAGVFFPGSASAAEAARLMAWADVLAHPSAREGLPITLLEAMRAGLPALAAPVGAIAEHLPDGAGLRHVPAGDAGAWAGALAALAGDDAERAALGAAGRAAFAARFRFDAHAARLAALYGWTAAPAAARGGARDPAFP